MVYWLSFLLTVFPASYCVPVAKPTAELRNSIGMTLKLIPAGKFRMGASDSDTDAEDVERPQHDVQITRSFYLADAEVTQEQYQEIMKVNPSRFRGTANPVEGVSWHDAVEFCRRLSAKEGRRYRLPTEAEWEYACRAGTETEESPGEPKLDLGDVAWYLENSRGTTHTVRTRQPNAWGLFDMHGNVLEWCSDAWEPYFYSGSPVNDPLSVEWESVRVCRGGDWNSTVSRCRSSARHWFPASFRARTKGFLGFRVVVDLDKEEGRSGNDRRSGQQRDEP